MSDSVRVPFGDKARKVCFVETGVVVSPSLSFVAVLKVEGRKELLVLVGGPTVESLEDEKELSEVQKVEGVEQPLGVFTKEVERSESCKVESESQEEETGQTEALTRTFEGHPLTPNRITFPAMLPNEATDREKELAKKYTRISFTSSEEGEEAAVAWFTYEQQSWQITGSVTIESANWHCWMLVKALEKMIDEFAQRLFSKNDE